MRFVKIGDRYRQVDYPVPATPIVRINDLGTIGGLRSRRGLRRAQLILKNVVWLVTARCFGPSRGEG